VLIATSCDNVAIAVAGGMKIESDGSVTLPPGAIITTGDGTEIVLSSNGSGGAITEGDETFASGFASAYTAQFSETESPETRNYLFIFVGSGGAEVIYSDGDAKTVHGGYVIQVNADGGVNIIEAPLTLEVRQGFANGNYYFAPVELLGSDYEYKIISRPGTSGGRAPSINIYGQFVFAAHVHQVMPMNISRAGVYIVKAAHKDGGIATIIIEVR